MTTIGLTMEAATRAIEDSGMRRQEIDGLLTRRKHASLNPNAAYRNPITIEDHQNSRLIAEPFHLLDCCPPTIGAGAIIITSAERARDLPNKPVYILGMGHCNTHSDIAWAPSM